jgi:hypothetical protein
MSRHNKYVYSEGFGRVSMQMRPETQTVLHALCSLFFSGYNRSGNCPIWRRDGVASIATGYRLDNQVVGV